MANIPFFKMAASGNDFVLIDARRRSFKKGLAALARRMCDRRRGVGADGLLILESSRRADVRMRIFNPDGSEPAMCGNGIRCAAVFCAASNRRVSRLRIETGAGIVRVEVARGMARVHLTPPKEIRLHRRIRIAGKNLQVHTIDTGVPHAVTLVGNVQKVDISKLGSALRFHSAFKPHGTNVDFVQIKSPRRIAVRTYERGVEAETLACGTGVSASGVIAGLVKGVSSPVLVETRSGDVLKVSFKESGGEIQHITLEGGANLTFHGEFELKNIT